MIKDSLPVEQNELRFTQEEDFNLLRYVYDYKANFDKSCKILGNKHTQLEYIQRYKELQEPKIASWTEQENIKLREYVKMFGDGKWSIVASLLPGRNSKQCRDHYINQLAPNIVKGRWTAEEDKKILESSKIYGSRWTKIKSQLPNRSELDIKNRYNKLIRELSDKGRILNIDQTMEEILKNPKVYENTKIAGTDNKSLNLKLEITQEMLEMQNKIKPSSSSFIPPLSRNRSSTETKILSASLIRPEDFIKKVDVSPYENVLIPAKTSDVVQVLVEEAKRHQKLQCYALNPYHIFKIKNFNGIYINSTGKYSHLPPNVYNKMIGNIEIPIPNDGNNNSNPSDSSSDPLLHLFQSSTATSTSSFPTSSSNHNLTKRRRLIEINPYIVEWYCPSCGNKNEAGLIECKFNNCNFFNPFINKYEQQVRIQRLEHQLHLLEKEHQEEQFMIRQLQMQIRQLKEEEEQQQQLLLSSKQNSKRSRNSKKSQPQPKRIYYTRQTPSDIEDEVEEISDANGDYNHFQQICDNKSSVYNSSDNDNIIPYPHQLLEQNVNKEDGTLKPWYCPFCGNKNDLLQDECNVCHSDNPNSYVNINGKIEKKFSLSNAEVPLVCVPPPPPPPPPPQITPQSSNPLSIPEDMIMNWICPSCGMKNDSTVDICMKCNTAIPREELLIQEHAINNNSSINSWSCIHCHHKNKNQNDICEKCKKERSYAFEAIDGDDYDDDYDDDVIESFNEGSTIATITPTLLTIESESKDNELLKPNKKEELHQK